jgi:carboxyl-terminal processing protease
MNDFFAKKFSSGIILIAIAGVAFGIGVKFGSVSHSPIEQVIGLENKEDGKPQTVDFSAFWRAWNTLSEKFVSSTTTKTTDQDRVWGSIQGLTASLKDPYTVFFPPEQTKEFESEISGNFEGIGMEIGIKDDILTVVAPLKNSPSERAGMRSGDQILKINDTITTGLKVDEAVRMLRGKRGTEVRVTVFRSGKKEPFEIKITRDVIAIPTLDTEGKTSSGSGEKTSGLRSDGIFVIKLYSFSEPSANLFRGALRQFFETPSQKLIIDLRGNPGGYLDAAVDMASWFLPSGKLVVSEDFGPNIPPKEYRSFGYNVFQQFRPNTQVVVLVNGGSASASEILAGALREQGKATLIGSKTFGKGSVQELIKITPETSLKVTVARWLTPLGHSISLVGITPDIEVKITPDDIEKGKDPAMERAVKFLTTGK